MQVQTFQDRKASLFKSALLICHFAVSTLCLTEIAVLDKVAPLLEVCQTVVVARGASASPDRSPRVLVLCISSLFLMPRL